MLAVLAVGAVTGSPGAGVHAAGIAHGVAHHVVELGKDRAVTGNASLDEEGASSMGGACGCPCCHVVVAGVAPSSVHEVIVATSEVILPMLADLLLATSAREGPRRPPRLP